MRGRLRGRAPKRPAAPRRAARVRIASARAASLATDRAGGTPRPSAARGPRQESFRSRLRRPSKQFLQGTADSADPESRKENFAQHGFVATALNPLPCTHGRACAFSRERAGWQPALQRRIARDALAGVDAESVSAAK